MLDSSPDIQSIQVEPKGLPVRRRREQVSVEKDIKIDIPKDILREVEDLNSQRWTAPGSFEAKERVSSGGGKLRLGRNIDYVEGVVSGVSGWTKVDLIDSFDNPVVIVCGQESGDVSQAVEAARAVVRNISSSSFEVNVYSADGSEVSEDVGYIVLEKGHYTLGGVEVEVGTYTTTGNMSAFSFNQSFGSSNIALVDTLQEETTHAYASRHLEGSLTSTGFESYWESFDESQGSDSDGGGFTAGYFAVRTDQSSSIIEAGLELDVDEDPDNDTWRNISTSNGYTPIVFSTIPSEPGGDPAIVGLRSISSSGFDVRITEGYASDTEQGHATDDVPWVTISKGSSNDYESDGFRVSPALALDEVSGYRFSKIVWSATEDADTNHSVFVKVSDTKDIYDSNGNKITSGWQEVSSGDSIPQLSDGASYEGKFLLIDHRLSTSVSSKTPAVSSLKMLVEMASRNSGFVGVPFLSLVSSSSSKIVLDISREYWHTAHKYKIYRSTTQGGPYDLIATIDSPSRVYEYTDSNVSGGTTYYYVVTIVRDSKEGSQSAELSATA